MAKSPHTGDERGIVPDWRAIGITRMLKGHDLWHHTIRVPSDVVLAYRLLMLWWWYHPAYGLTTPRARRMPPGAHSAVAMGGGDTESTPGYAQRRGVAPRCLPHRFVPRVGLHYGSEGASHNAAGARVVSRSLRRLGRSSGLHGVWLDVWDILPVGS
jgi:hypothetical protein